MVRYSKSTRIKQVLSPSALHFVSVALWAQVATQLMN